jgi:PPK2 family polyphosphate:nucleotide phosphotransferase
LPSRARVRYGRATAREASEAMGKPIVVKPGHKVRLEDVDPNDTGHYKTKEEAHEETVRDVHRLAELQGRLYAENRRAVLVVLQGMDTSGKDGTIRHVLAGVSPVGSQVSAFVAPSEEERDHDFLWRVYKRLPRYGNLGVFNRSHYEDVLVVRVRKLAPASVWKPRFEQINQFEELITSMNTTVLKFFLHIDRAEQKKRLLSRLRDPEKNWKYQPSDLDDRAHWDDYMRAYEDVFAKCSTKHAPWHIVPANKKWYRNLVVARVIADTLESMAPELPKVEIDLAKVKVPD